MEKRKIRRVATGERVVVAAGWVPELKKDFMVERGWVRIVYSRLQCLEVEVGIKLTHSRGTGRWV